MIAASMGCKDQRYRNARKVASMSSVAGVTDIPPLVERMHPAGMSARFEFSDDDGEAVVLDEAYVYPAGQAGLGSVAGVVEFEVLTRVALTSRTEMSPRIPTAQWAGMEHAYLL